MGMTNEVRDAKWTEIAVTVNAEDIDAASALANMAVPYGIYIEDYSALEEETLAIAHVDLIEESLLQKDRSKGVIHLYVDESESPAEAASFLRERLNACGIAHDITVSDCRIEDWQNNWKQYFKPMPVGRRLLICPLWETAPADTKRQVLHIEPGLAFGTGSHPTTKLCLETLEDYIREGDTVLDIGCGSGILSLASLLLGAGRALGVDIDELAVKTARANAEENHFGEDRFTAVQGDLSDKVHGTYDVVIANIVADIIIRFNGEVGGFLKDGGVYITGGIIEAREQDVLASFEENGFEVIERRENNGWLVFVLKKQ